MLYFAVGCSYLLTVTHSPHPLSHCISLRAAFVAWRAEFAEAHEARHGSVEYRVYRKDPMPKRDAIEVEGVVTEALPNAMFRVALDGDRFVMAHLSGKVRLNFVRIVPGDRVRVELSPYDLSQGRITWRNRN